MFSTLTCNTIDLDNTKTKRVNIANNNISWFESKNILDQSALSKQYATIFQQHKQQKKWVLFINPDETSLEQLANIHDVDISKILCVTMKSKQDIKNQKEATHLNIEQIKSVLCRGNCSAVILSNASFKQEEMIELNNCAKKGETHCLVLKTIALHDSAKLH